MGSGLLSLALSLPLNSFLAGEEPLFLKHIKWTIDCEIPVIRLRHPRNLVTGLS